MTRYSFVTICLLLLPVNIASFNVKSQARTSHHFDLHATIGDHDSGEFFSRRSFFAASTAGVVAALSVNVESVSASGGATAGGAYLLSAKQRYNDRVTQAVKSLLTAAAALESGSTAEAKAFFSGDETGTWKDCKAAGYLLSNAFRRNSTTPPDSLPAVKKWKALAAEVEAFQKKLDKKGPAAALTVYPKVEDALEIWLSEIDLPSSKEL